MKTLEDYDFYEIPASEARTLGPFGADDYPVTVTCYRQKEAWKSKRAAVAFYQAGANCCGGSEQERYSTIVSKLIAGNRDVDDSVFGWH